MLNEIYTLHRSLQRCGLSVPKRHTWLKFPRREAGIIVGLDALGGIGTVEFCPADKMASIWKIMPDNQKSFPVINLKVPIYQVNMRYEMLCKLIDEPDALVRYKRMQRLGELVSLAYSEEELGKLGKRFSGFPAELQTLIPEENQDLAPVFVILQRIRKLADGARQFLNQLAAAIVLAARMDTLQDAELVATILFGKRNKKKRIFEKKEVPVVFDLADYARFNRRIIEAELGEYVNKALLQSLNNGGNDKASVCALTGITGQLEDETFPEPKLPVLGPSYLFSMNKDAGCHERYGLISSTIFPVNRELTQSLQDSLLYVTHSERQGLTWQSVPANNKKRVDLLIAYLEDMPAKKVPLASLFGESMQDPEIIEGRFEKAASSIYSALRGESAFHKNSFVRVVVMSSVDKGRRQILHSATYTVESILAGADEWQKAAKNHPLFFLYLPWKKGEKSRPFSPPCPSPAAVMRCFHQQWVRQGDEQLDTQSCTMREVHEVMFGDEPVVKTIAQRFLQMALQRTTPLLLRTAAALRVNNDNSLETNTRRAALTAVAILAISLYKLGHQKEEYMKSAAFNIGKLLALADTLHQAYCKEVRNKEMPSQLLGNAMMGFALDNPKRALARLSERLTIYVNWAKKSQGEAFIRAKWVVKQMGIVSDELATMELPEKTDDTVRAQLLLGYLARSERENPEQPVTEENRP